MDRAGVRVGARARAQARVGAELAGEDVLRREEDALGEHGADDGEPVAPPEPEHALAAHHRAEARRRRPAALASGGRHLQKQPHALEWRDGGLGGGAGKGSDGHGRRHRRLLLLLARHRGSLIPASQETSCQHGAIPDNPKRRAPSSCVVSAPWKDTFHREGHLPWKTPSTVFPRIGPHHVDKQHSPSACGTHTHAHAASRPSSQVLRSTGPAGRHRQCAEAGVGMCTLSA